MGQVFVPPPVRPTYQPSPGASQVWDDLFRSNQSNWTPFGEPSQAPVAAPASPPGAREDAAWTALLAGAGLTGADLRTTPREAAFAAGLVLRRVVAGLFVLLQARAKAKAQLGAQGTLAELEGNSPLKYSLSPEEALLRLLRPKEPHYLAADRAVEDAFRDLQAHQVATLLAMQSALRTTLERFSPSAIRARTRIVGFWASLFPAARAAALWRAYEHDFEGVAQGSDEAFMDVFSRAFREAYEQADREGNSPRRR
jgi:type VI secretion system FHA domain protein